MDEVVTGTLSRLASIRKSISFRSPPPPPPAPKRPPPLTDEVPHTVYFGADSEHPEVNKGQNPMNPPLAREDPFFWLRDDTRQDPNVLAHLEIENKYTEYEMEHLKDFQEDLYLEMLSHLKETDEEVPYKHGPFLYYSKTEEGKAYRTYCRKAADVENAEEVVVLDVNLLGAEKSYCHVTSVEPSPSHNMIAYAADYSGYETYSIRIIKDLTTKEEIEDVVENTTGEIVWGSDDSAFFYLAMDAQHRPDRVFLHVIGTPQSQDICLLTELDERFWMGVSKTTDNKYLILGAESKETSEYYVVDLQDIKGGEDHASTIPNALYCFAERKQGIRYEVEHHKGYFYFITNKDNAKNSKIQRLTVEEFYHPDDDIWVDIRDYKANEQIDNLLVFENQLVVVGRKDGVPALWVISSPETNPGEWTQVNFSESNFSLSEGNNYEYTLPYIRVSYSSFLTPRQVINIDLTSLEFTILKEQEIPGYDRTLYETKEIKVPCGEDQVLVPISYVYNKKTLEIDHGVTHEHMLYRAPCILYGYGSYGICVDPSFDYKRLPLLDRGVVYAIAHVRGGGEFGRTWYEDQGKYLNKMNTFLDFIDCAKALIAKEITTPSQLAIVGRSAGGLLVGAVCNMFPSLFRAAVADVPFVDVMNTMSDASIPLTVTEWEEWGNPNEETYHNYMLKYSPYDNVKAQHYPAMLVTAGLNDPRVAYWEPAKWVAKLRKYKNMVRDEDEVSHSLLLLKTDLSSGHFSASDRYKFLRESAFEYSFILEQIHAMKTL